MKFYFYPRLRRLHMVPALADHSPRELTDEEVREHLSAAQIEEAIEAKRTDPLEEVSYMTRGGIITCEIE